MLPSRAVLLLCAAWLPQNACALSQRPIQPISLATNDSLVSYWLPKNPERSLLVVPQFKLLICSVPKNACTQFEEVAQSLTGRDDNALKYWPVKHDLHALLKDQAWTKAVFLRDPLERLISGYRSKCEPPMEGDGHNCMNFEDSTPNSWPSFDHFVSELHHCHNPHFDPQVSFCSLGTDFDSFNFVGRITKDYDAVASDVQQLFKQATTRSGAKPTAKVAEAIEKYFPSAGFTQGHLDHYHNDTDVLAYYKNEATLNAALQHYIVDYDQLPLEPPAWVSKDRLNRARSNALAALPAPGEAKPSLACRLPR